MKNVWVSAVTSLLNLWDSNAGRVPRINDEVQTQTEAPVVVSLSCFRRHSDRFPKHNCLLRRELLCICARKLHARTGMFYLVSAKVFIFKYSACPPAVPVRFLAELGARLCAVICTSFLVVNVVMQGCQTGALGHGIIFYVDSKSVISPAGRSVHMLTWCCPA